MPLDAPPKPKRGFATLSPERRHELAVKGGQSVPADRRAFSQSPELASLAGTKGGRASQSSRKERK